MYVRNQGNLKKTIKQQVVQVVCGLGINCEGIAQPINVGSSAII